MTIILIIVGAIMMIVLLFAFAKSAAREAERITIEASYRLNSLSSLVEACNYVIGENPQEVEKLDRKYARLKARAEEVASRQTPVWKVFSKVTRKRR